MPNILEKIRDFVFRYTVSRHSAAARRYVDYAQARSVLLLFESDVLEKNQMIRDIIKQLADDGKQVTACGYADKKDVQQAVLPLFRILGKNDVDWFQRPLPEVIDDMLEQHFDIMIDLTITDIRPLMYVALKADAEFKVGRSSLCHMQIAMPPEMLENDDIGFELGSNDLPVKILWKEYYKYLNEIRSADNKQ